MPSEFRSGSRKPSGPLLEVADEVALSCTGNGSAMGSPEAVPDECV